MSILLTDGIEVIERDIPNLGLLRYEDYPAGTWLTQRGEPAKRGRRRYLLGDLVLDSVSSIVDTIDKPGLVRWAEDHGTRGGVKAERLGELDGVPEEEWAERCRLLGLGPSAARDEGSDRGKAIHAVFESMARTGEPPDASLLPATWRPWLRGAVRAWLTLDPQLIESECIVCNPEFGYAGRFDLYATCGGTPTLVDYKTGRGKVYEQAHYQTRGYAECFPVSGLEPPARIVIVGISEDGDPQLVECEASSDDWYDLLRVFRSRKAIAAGMAAQRKALRKASA